MKNIKNFFSYALGDLFVKGILFISLPLLTRIMSPEQYGKLSIINAAVLIFYVFVSLNLQSAVLNRIMSDKCGFNDYLSTCLYFLIPFHIILVCISPYISKYLSPILGIEDQDFQWILIICILLSYIYIYTSYLQGVEKGKEYVIFNIVNKLGELALIFIFAYFIHREKYLSKIYAQIIICIPFFIYIWFKLKPFLNANFNLKDLKIALFFGVPLIVHVLSNSLLAQVDRIIINNQLGNKAAGIYSFAYNIGMGISVVIMAWNSSWQPQLYKFINNGESEKIRSVNKASTIVVFMISTLFILFSKEIVMFLSTDSYYEGINIIPLIIIGNAYIHIYLIYVNFVFFNKKTIFISLATLAALAVNVFGNYLLIPAYGITGAALSTVLAYILLSVVHLINSKLNASKKMHVCINFKPIAYYTIGFGIVYIMVIYLNSLSFVSSLSLKFIFLVIISVYLYLKKPYKYLVIK